MSVINPVVFAVKVAGITFAFDPTKPSGKRVIPGSVMVDGEALDLDKTYRLCTKAYLANGKDGYNCLLGSEWLVSEDDGPRLSTIVQNHFRSVERVTGRRKSKYRHHQSIIARRLRRNLSQKANAGTKEGEDRTSQAAEDVRGLWKKARIAISFARNLSIDEAEAKEAQAALAPKVEGRIKIVGVSAE